MVPSCWAAWSSPLASVSRVLACTPSRCVWVCWGHPQGTCSFAASAPVHIACTRLEQRLSHSTACQHGTAQHGRVMHAHIRAAPCPSRQHGLPAQASSPHLQPRCLTCTTKPRLPPSPPTSLPPGAPHTTPRLGRTLCTPSGKALTWAPPQGAWPRYAPSYSSSSRSGQVGGVAGVTPAQDIWGVVSYK